MINPFNTVLLTSHYCFESAKVSSPVRFLLICDLHSCFFGENQHKLLNATNNIQPDALLLAGDIIDDRMPIKGAQVFLNGIKDKYPAFYVAGNHEFYNRRIAQNKKLIQRYNIPVLAGDKRDITLHGQRFQIFGTDDAAIGKSEFSNQFSCIKTAKIDSIFSILLSHNPQYVKEFNDCGCDLTLCGHTHGGQWIIPKLINGVFAPGQGFFPRYAGGRYNLKHTTMIVGRGLAKESTKLIPRICNPPELAVITIKPPSR